MINFRPFWRISQLILILIINQMYAQDSPYIYKPKADYGIVIGGTIFSATGNLLKINTPALTESEIQSLVQAGVNEWDRRAIDHDSRRADTWSDMTFLGSYGLMGGLLLLKPIRNQWKQHGVLIVETLLITESFTSLSKALFRRPRPYIYNSLRSVESKQSANGRHSFFSGHTSHSAAGAFFFAKVFNDYFPESKWKIPIWVVGAALPAITGFLRVKAGKHFPTDVITGYVVGGTAGLLIPHLHKVNRKMSLKSYPFRFRLVGSGVMVQW